MKILVTGCAGFIGSRVAESLLLRDMDVTGIDRMCKGNDSELKEQRLNDLKPHKRFRFHRLNIISQLEMESLFSRSAFEAVFNLAAKVGVRASVANPDEFVEVNIRGLVLLLELCRRHHVPKFIQASSSSIYGDKNKLRGPLRGPKEAYPVISPYAASKAAAEIFCFVYHRLYNIDITALRYFTVYGPRGRIDMSPFIFIHRLLSGRPIRLFGNGLQSRDFTYVADIVRGTILALKLKGYSVFDLGCGENHSISYLIELLEALTGRRAKIEKVAPHAGDVYSTLASNEKARVLLGWKPSLGIKAGMKETVGWMQRNWSWVKDIKC